MENPVTLSTGNVAKRCLAEPEKLASILRLPPKLVIAMQIMCNAVASNSHVDLTKLYNVGQEFKIEYKKHFLDENGVPWRQLSSTVHRVVDHSKQILERFPCPPGSVIRIQNDNLPKVA